MQGYSGRRLYTLPSCPSLLSAAWALSPRVSGTHYFSYNSYLSVRKGNEGAGDMMLRHTTFPCMIELLHGMPQERTMYKNLCQLTISNPPPPPPPPSWTRSFIQEQKRVHERVSTGQFPWQQRQLIPRGFNKRSPGVETRVFPSPQAWHEPREGVS